MVISGCSLLFVYMKSNASQLCPILVSYFSKIWQLILFMFDNAYFRCNILKRVPNSALWLLRFPAAGEMRLRACMCSRMGRRSFQIFVLLIVCFLIHEPLSDAAAQGVQPDQIIFTDVAMKNEHIRRSSLADLFLDT